MQLRAISYRQRINACRYLAAIDGRLLSGQGKPLFPVHQLRRLDLICYTCNTIFVAAIPGDQTRRGRRQTGECHMTFLRWIASPPAAVLITVGLFLMMATMIRSPEINWPEPKAYADINVTFEPKPPKTTLYPPKPQPLPNEPPIEIDLPDSKGLPDPIPAPPQKGPADTGFDQGGLTIDPPLIKHAPQYPQSCSGKGVEGVVIVQFDVTPTGEVVNPRILETPDRCFRRAVIATVSKWKYPPARSGSMRYSVVETFNFQLVD